MRLPRKFSTNLEERKLQSIQRVELSYLYDSQGAKKKEKLFATPKSWANRFLGGRGGGKRDVRGRDEGVAASTK